MTAYRIRNWSSYNRALVNRGDISFWFSKEFLAQWKNGEGLSNGNQRFSDSVIKCAYVLKQIYRLSLRSTQGMMRSILNMLGCNELKAPDYTTISRRGKTLTFEHNLPPKGKSIHVLIDATGVRVFGEGQWKIRWHGKTREQLWRKLHLAIDADSQMILASKVSESARLDCNYLKPLLDSVKGEIREVSGDAGYDKKLCYRAVHKRRAKPTFPPQRNSSVQRNKIKIDEALIARDKVIQYVGKGSDRLERLRQWKKENNYYKRSLVETTMSRLKYLFGDEMTSRNFANQVTELTARCYVINKINMLGLPKSEPVSES